MSSYNPLLAIKAGRRVHIAGGVPTTIPDVPVDVVFLLFFIAGVALNVAQFIHYGKKLRWQMALFGFCMARITTMVMRIVWSQYPDNLGIAIAAIVFLNAGVIIIFLINLMMSKKILFRTHHQYFAEHPHKKAMVKKIVAATAFLLLAFLAIVIVGAVQRFLTADASIQTIDSKLLKVGLVAFLVYTCLPYPIIIFNAIWRVKAGRPSANLVLLDKDEHLDSSARQWTNNSTVWKNSAVILISSSLVIFEYAIKVTAAFADASINHWYYQKGPFYATTLLPESLALYLLIFVKMAPTYGGLQRAGRDASHA